MRGEEQPVAMGPIVGPFLVGAKIGDAKAEQNVNLVIFARLDAKTEKYSGRYVLKILRAGKETKLSGRIKECEAG